MSPIRKHNVDLEYFQDRVPLIVEGMDVGSCTIVGRTLTAIVRSPKIAQAMIEGGYRATRVVVEVERDADGGRPQSPDGP